MGMTQADWEWDNRIDEYWSESTCPDKDQYYGRWHSMSEFIPESQDEYIIVHYPGWCPEVSSWEDEAADRWPITIDKKGWWMAIPKLPSIEKGNEI
jgi:hypothetical protein